MCSLSCHHQHSICGLSPSKKPLQNPCSVRLEYIGIPVKVSNSVLCIFAVNGILALQALTRNRAKKFFLGSTSIVTVFLNVTLTPLQKGVPSSKYQVAPSFLQKGILEVPKPMMMEFDKPDQILLMFNDLSNW